MPAHAGIQIVRLNATQEHLFVRRLWIPAFAGMTMGLGSIARRRRLGGYNECGVKGGLGRLGDAGSVAGRAFGGGRLAEQSFGKKADRRRRATRGSKLVRALASVVQNERHSAIATPRSVLVL